MREVRYYNHVGQLCCHYMIEWLRYFNHVGQICCHYMKEVRYYNHVGQICTIHDFTELKLNNHLLFTFYSSIQMSSPFSCYFLDLGISFPGLRWRMFYVLRKKIKMFFLILRGIWDSTWKKK
jgi:hypothetical protein